MLLSDLSLEDWRCLLLCCIALDFVLLLLWLVSARIAGKQALRVVRVALGVTLSDRELALLHCVGITAFKILAFVFHVIPLLALITWARLS